MSGNFFSKILILKMNVKMIFRSKTKNHTADPEIGFLTKSILKSYGRAAAMPTVRESNDKKKILQHQTEGPVGCSGALNQYPKCVDPATALCLKILFAFGIQKDDGIESILRRDEDFFVKIAKLYWIILSSSIPSSRKNVNPQIRDQNSLRL